MEEVELQGRQSDQASLLRPSLVDAARKKFVQYQQSGLQISKE